MQKNKDEYWERCWQEEDAEQLQQFLEGWTKHSSKEMEIFKEHGIKTVCDAACGFGAYTIAFASRGFQVSGFDISETAVEIAERGLQQYGFTGCNLKVASILDTGYEDASFDGVNAHAVLDHLTITDAKKALQELLRIVKKDGLVMISFDTAEEEDFTESHVFVEEGTMQYTKGDRAGMLFHPYDW